MHEIIWIKFKPDEMIIKLSIVHKFHGHGSALSTLFCSTVLTKKENRDISTRCLISKDISVYRNEPMSPIKLISLTTRDW